MSPPAGPPVDRALLDEAVGLAQRAGAFTLQHFRTADLAIDTKGDGTPVTVADRGAEAQLRAEIGERFADDGIFGEEEAEKPGTSGRRWIIDPIDGTKAFTHGVPLYSNLLALQDAHGIAIGVINLPALGETVYAARGLGAWCNDERIHVNDTAQAKGSYLMTSGLSFWDGDLLDEITAAGLHLRTWGDAYGYALVASGRAEAMVDVSAELYDLAPVPVIMAEAGGRFTDLTGAIDPGGGSGLATNGSVHDELLAIFSSRRRTSDGRPVDA
jgi:histidinol phosphatase-like enzyme (inositol monophosphatase family)